MRDAAVNTVSSNSMKMGKDHRTNLEDVPNELS